MPNVDLIPAPAADAVTFRLRRSRYWLWTALIIAPAGFLFRVTLPVVAAMFGAPFVPPGPLEIAATWVAMGAGAATATAVVIGPNPSWVRASSAGLEFAASGRRPVFLPWAAVAGIRLRLAGPLTRLVVTPTSRDAASVAPVRARAPWFRHGGYQVDVGLMTPGPAVLLAELHRRLAG